MMQSSTSTNALTDQDAGWQDILAITEHILNCANDNLWDDLPNLAQHRDALIRDYFAQPISVDNALRLHDEIRQLMAMDEQVLGLARKSQADVGAALKQMQSGNKATQAYGKNAGL